MARAASAPKKAISMEEALWKSADKLRGSVEPADFPAENRVPTGMQNSPESKKHLQYLM